MILRIVWKKTDPDYPSLIGRFAKGVHETEEKGTRSGGFYILILNARRIVGWCSSVALFIYLAAVTGMYFFLLEPGGHKISWWQVSLPTQWREVRRTIAEESINRGLVCLKTARYAEGVMRIESGLLRIPSRNDARIELVRIYAAAGLASRAIAVLKDGDVYMVAEPENLRLTVALARHTEDFAFLLRMCDTTLRASPPVPAAILAEAQTQRITALQGLGRKVDALEAARSSNNPGTADQAAAIGTTMIEAGARDEALKFCERILVAHPDWMAVQGLKARALREGGDLATLKSSLDALYDRRRTDQETHLLRVVEFWKAPLRQPALEALEKYIAYFGSDSAKLVTAARVFQGLPEGRTLVEICRQRAITLGHREEPYWVCIIESYLVAGDIEGIRPWEEKLRVAAPKDPALKDWLTVVQCLLTPAWEDSFATADRLVDSMKRLNTGPAGIEKIVTLLAQAKKPITANRVAEHGRIVYPASSRVQRIEVTEAQPLRTVSSEKTVAPQQESRTSAGADTFFEKLEAALKAGNPEEALSMVVEARLKRPDWMSSRERDLLWVELRAARLKGDVLGLQTSSRSLARLGEAERKRLMGLARDMLKEGQRAEAELLGKETLRADAENEDAKQFLEHFKPKK
jgi:tetratricopeptide (TPR) repeat protein